MNRTLNETGLVFFKTAKAHEELAERQHGLRPKARQLLILLDGERTLGALANLAPAHELHLLVHELRQAGFITDQSSPPPELRPHRELAPPPLDPVQLTRTKAYLIEISQQHLGLMASQLQREIAEADDAAAMRSALAHWNMALRESRTGAGLAGPCLKKAHEIIGWSTA